MAVRCPDWRKLLKVSNKTKLWLLSHLPGPRHSASQTSFHIGGEGAGEHWPELSNQLKKVLLMCLLGHTVL